MDRRARSVPARCAFPKRLALASGGTYCRCVWSPLTAARRFLPGGILTLSLQTLAAAQPSDAAPSAAESTTLPASIEANLQVELERDPSATSCPDLPWFQAEIASHLHGAKASGDFAIELSKPAGYWQAIIQIRAHADGAAPTTRALNDRSASCEPLSQAAAITIAILAEDHAQQPQAQAPSAALAEAPAPKQPALAPASPRSGERALSLWVGGGGGLTIGWIAPTAPALGFNAALESPHWRSALRLMLTTEQTFDVDPGRVIVQGWLVTLLTCARATSGQLGGALCAALDAAMLRASGQGYAEATPATRGYGAVGLELQPSWTLAGRYRISAAFGGMLPFTQQSFSVSGVGVAYIPPPLNWRTLLLLELGAF